MNNWRPLIFLALLTILIALHASLYSEEITDQSVTDSIGYVVMDVSHGEKAQSKAHVWFELRDGDETHLSGIIDQEKPKRIIHFWGQSATPSESIRLEFTAGEHGNDEVPKGYIEGRWTRDADSGIFTLTGEWFMPSGEDSTPVTFEQVIPQGSAPIEYHLFEETYKRRRGDKILDRRARITFPQVSSDETEHQRINAVIRHWAVQRLIAPSVKPKISDNSPSLAKIEDALRASLPTRKQPHSIKVELEESIELDHEFSVLYNQNNILCVMLNMKQYLGGAHEMFWATHLMFDLRSGKLLYVKDQLKKGWETEVAKMVLEDLRSHWGDSLEEKAASLESIRKKLSRNEDFFIKEGCLGLYYAPYEIGPFSIGAPMAIIPLEKIYHLIEKGSPFETLFNTP